MDSQPRHIALRKADSGGGREHTGNVQHRTTWSWVPGASILAALAAAGDGEKSVREAHGIGIDHRRVTGEQSPVMTNFAFWVEDHNSCSFVDGSVAMVQGR